MSRKEILFSWYGSNKWWLFTYYHSKTILSIHCFIYTYPYRHCMLIQMIGTPDHMLHIGFFRLDALTSPVDHWLYTGLVILEITCADGSSLMDVLVIVCLKAVASSATSMQLQHQSKECSTIV